MLRIVLRVITVALVIGRALGGRAQRPDREHVRPSRRRGPRPGPGRLRPPWRVPRPAGFAVPARQPAAHRPLVPRRAGRLAAQAPPPFRPPLPPAASLSRQRHQLQFALNRPGIGYVFRLRRTRAHVFPVRWDRDRHVAIPAGRRPRRLGRAFHPVTLARHEPLRRCRPGDVFQADRGDREGAGELQIAREVLQPHDLRRQRQRAQLPARGQAHPVADGVGPVAVPLGDLFDLAAPEAVGRPLRRVPVRRGQYHPRSAEARDRLGAVPPRRGRGAPRRPGRRARNSRRTGATRRDPAAMTAPGAASAARRE